MTGYATLESATQAIRGGAYDYLTKPFKIDEIRVAVKSACEKIFIQKQHRVYVDELRKA